MTSNIIAFNVIWNTVTKPWFSTSCKTGQSSSGNGNEGKENMKMKMYNNLHNFCFDNPVINIGIKEMP